MQQQQAAASAAAAELAGASSGPAVSPAGLSPLYPPAERSQIQESWDALMRWSKTFSKRSGSGLSPIEAADKVVVFGGGSFGTAMGSSLALKKPQLDVVLLLRDPYLCKDINSSHCNTKYLPVRQGGLGAGAAAADRGAGVVAARTAVAALRHGLVQGTCPNTLKWQMHGVTAQQDHA